MVVERPDALARELCDGTVALLADLQLTEGGIAGEAGDNPRVDTTVRRVRQAVVARTAATAAVYERVAEVAHDCNRTSFGFDLEDADRQGLTEDLVIVEYGPGDFYNWHLDLGPAEQTRKISLSIALSAPSDYSGGALSFPGREVSSVPRGGAVVFPSFLIHGVQPVTAGRRIALLAWVGGPRFR